VKLKPVYKLYAKSSPVLFDNILLMLFGAGIPVRLVRQVVYACRRLNFLKQVPRKSWNESFECPLSNTDHSDSEINPPEGEPNSSIHNSWIVRPSPIQVGL